MVPSDADGDDSDGGGNGGGDFPTTLPAWLVPRGYHAQGSNIPFRESLILMYTHIYMYICISYMGPGLAPGRAPAHTGAQGPSSCTLECMKVYTLHHKEFEQVTPPLHIRLRAGYS